MLFPVRNLFFGFALVLAASIPALAAEDPTGGKPFFPWIWQDQLRPTFRSAMSPSNLLMLPAIGGAVIVSHQYDPDVRADYGEHSRMPAEISRYGDWIGAGYLSAGVSVAGLLLDQPNGLMISRAVLLTSISHITIATAVNRERPNHGPNSFPSGHTSTSFALAISLAYAYGPWVGVPAIALATFVGASRVADNAHWFSDTVAGAGLAYFWARASYRIDRKWGSEQVTYSKFAPGLIRDTPAIMFASDF